MWPYTPARTFDSQTLLDTARYKMMSKGSQNRSPNVWGPTCCAEWGLCEGCWPPLSPRPPGCYWGLCSVLSRYLSNQVVLHSEVTRRKTHRACWRNSPLHFNCYHPSFHGKHRSLSLGKVRRPSVQNLQGTQCSQQLRELRSGYTSPVEPSDETQTLTDTLTVVSQEIMKQSTQLSRTWFLIHRNCEMINMHWLKPLIWEPLLAIPSLSLESASLTFCLSKHFRDHLFFQKAFPDFSLKLMT